MILIQKSDVLLSNCNRINTRNIHLNLVSSSNETKLYRKFPMRTAHALSIMCAMLHCCTVVLFICCVILKNHFIQLLLNILWMHCDVCRSSWITFFFLIELLAEKRENRDEHSMITYVSRKNGLRFRLNEISNGNIIMQQKR